MHIRRNVFLIVLLVLTIILNPLTSFSQPQEESLYKRLGGVYNIAAVVDDFVDRLLADPIITTNKNVVSAMGKITKPGLKYQLTELFCQAAGGSQKYNGRSMKESHQGLSITETEWQAMMKDFLATIAKFNIKGLEQNELLVIVGATKGDIVVSAPQAVQPQAAGEPTSAVAVPQPSATPTPPSPTPAAIPTPPNPANAVAIPQPPTTPTPPSPTPSAIPTPPNPANAVAVPQIPSLPAFPENPIPAAPSAAPADSVQPDLELPSNPPADTPVQPQTETPSDSDLPSQEAAPAPQNDLPSEPELEPAE